MLVDISHGDRSAWDRLAPLLYDELRELAVRSIVAGRSDHILQPTALVSEAFVRLIDQSSIDGKGRAHFFAVAAEAMRRVLVDYARQHLTATGGGGAKKVTLTGALEPSADREVDLLNLDEALTALGTLNERQKQVIDLRFFGGLTVDETAHVLGVSRQTVTVDWRAARGWLQKRLAR
jgi:RNA polymerase sigma factor (TIGR02999 family)